MKRATAIVLVVAALVAGAVFVFRRSPEPEVPRRREPREVGEPALPVDRPAPAARTPAAEPPPPLSPVRPPTPGPLVNPAPVIVEIPKAGIVSGTVRVGVAPNRAKQIKMDADPRCAALHAQPPLSEEILVDSNLGLRWAFVYVKEGARSAPPPVTPVILAQSGCLYKPRVVGVQVGQPLLVLNDDPLLHNIHALPFANREFNFGQPTKGLEDRRRFTTPEVMVKVKCDVHPWMTAWIGVLEHPYFAVTDAEGAYALPELPAGLYTVEVWHEAYRSVDQLVELLPGQGAIVNFRLDDRK